MTIRRRNPTAELSYENLSLADNTSTNAGALPLPSGGVVVGDELFIAEAYQWETDSGHSISTSPGAGWHLDAFTSSDQTFSGGTEVRSQIRFWRKTANGSNDTPSMLVSTTLAGSSVRKVWLTAVMWAYRGAALSPGLGGENASPSVGGPTSAYNINTIGAANVFVAAAYQSHSDDLPTLYADEGFNDFFSANPAGTNVPPAIVVADKFPVSGTVAGPRWNVTRGDLTYERHSMGFAYPYTESESTHQQAVIV